MLTSPGSPSPRSASVGPNGLGGSALSSPGSPGAMGFPQRQGSVGTPTSLWGSGRRRKKDFVLPMSPSQPRTPDA